jgi:pre-60S factor REI1
MSLTSTTAPGKLFSTRLELQTHYKSDWHRYNLKRRENGLSMLNEEEFNVRLEAALALRREREGREERSGLDHLKVRVLLLLLLECCCSVCCLC